MLSSAFLFLTGDVKLQGVEHSVPYWASLSPVDFGDRSHYIYIGCKPLENSVGKSFWGLSSLLD